MDPSRIVTLPLSFGDGGSPSVVSSTAEAAMEDVRAVSNVQLVEGGAAAGTCVATPVSAVGAPSSGPGSSLLPVPTPVPTPSAGRQGPASDPSTPVPSTPLLVLARTRTAIMPEDIAAAAAAGASGVAVTTPSSASSTPPVTPVVLATPVRSRYPGMTSSVIANIGKDRPPHAQTLAGLDQRDLLPPFTSAHPLACERKSAASDAGGYSQTSFVPGMKKDNQDSMVVVHPFGSPVASFAAVFDGHGVHGSKVTTFLRNHLPRELLASPLLASDKEAALRSAFASTNRKLGLESFDLSVSGAAGNAVLIQGNTLWCANVGDCRGVLARRSADGSLEAVRISMDHKPDVPEERERLEKAGADLRGFPDPRSPGTFVPPIRVWIKGQDKPGLAMSRAFGNQMAESVGVIAVPSITRTELIASDEFIVMGSDGMWDFLPIPKVLSVVEAALARGCSAQDAAADLVAFARHESMNTIKQADDITAVVLRIHASD